MKMSILPINKIFFNSGYVHWLFNNFRVIRYELDLPVLEMAYFWHEISDMSKLFHMLHMLVMMGEFLEAQVDRKHLNPDSE